MSYTSGNCIVDLTRTGDTNAYNAGDAIGSATSSGGAVLTLPNMGSAGGPTQVMVTATKFSINLSAVISGMGNYRLHLYNASPGSALADNAAWDLPSGDRSAYLGYLDLGTPVDIGSTLYVQVTGQNMPVRVPAGGTLYGYLQTIGAYTPSSSDVFKIELAWIEV